MVGGRVVNVDRRTVARIAAPVAFLVAMTIAVLVVRSGLSDDTPTARPAATQPRSGAAIVVVRAGDTLDGIARRTGTTVEAILRLNPGIDPEALRVGQSVRVAP
jgi:LysM repeat protein